MYALIITATLLILTLPLQACAGKKNSSNVLRPTVDHDVVYSDKIGLSFPYTGNQKIPSSNQITRSQFGAFHAKELGVDHVRWSDDWKFREPKKGKGYNWGPTSNRLKEYVTSKQIKVLMTFEANGPSHRCARKKKHSCVYKNNLDLKKYTKDYLNQFKGLLYKVQFGNEMLSPSLYLGTPQEYVSAQRLFAKAVKETAPSLPVVLGGLSAGTIRRYAACVKNITFPLIGSKGRVYDTREKLDKFCSKKWVQKENAGVQFILKNAIYDEVDLHLYDDYENWPLLYESFRSEVPESKAIIISEFGGPNSRWDSKMGKDSSDEAYQAEMLKKYIKTIRNIGVEAYFFKLGENNDGSPHQYSGLMDRERKKLSYYIFKER